MELLSKISSLSKGYMAIIMLPILLMFFAILSPLFNLSIFINTAYLTSNANYAEITNDIYRLIEENKSRQDQLTLADIGFDERFSAAEEAEEERGSFWTSDKWFDAHPVGAFFVKTGILVSMIIALFVFIGMIKWYMSHTAGKIIYLTYIAFNVILACSYIYGYSRYTESFPFPYSHLANISNGFLMVHSINIAATLSLIILPILVCSRSKPETEIEVE